MPPDEPKCNACNLLAIRVSISSNEIDYILQSVSAMIILQVRLNQRGCLTLLSMHRGRVVPLCTACMPPHTSCCSVYGMTLLF